MRVLKSARLDRFPLLKTAQEAVAFVKSRDNVFAQGMAMTSTILGNALASHGEARKLRDVKVWQLHTEGALAYEKYPDIFRIQNCFVGANIRKSVQCGKADFVPIFLSDLPRLFRNNLSLDAAFVQITPPDKNGFCSLGTSVDATLAAVESAKTVVAVINPQVPFTRGDSVIHISKIDVAVENSSPLYESHAKPPTEAAATIGKLIADNLVADGACLQIGIGAIPDAVLDNLGGHRRLGIHTEMLAPGVVNLIKKGIVDGTNKALDKGSVVTTFALGNQAFYDFLDDNPTVLFKDASYTNDPHVIRQQNRMTAINGAIEVDLSGQVCADSVGFKLHSGVGGSNDFIRGASLAEDGKAIIALPSRTKTGKSKIVVSLAKGAGVTATRNHVRYVVTEYGIADLFGKNVRERQRALIDIAHPMDRNKLERQARRLK